MSDASLAGRHVPRISGLPIAPANNHASGWYGMLTVLATEGALFAYLLFSYFYLASQSVNPWPPGGAPRLAIAGPNTAILILSSLAAWWGQRGIEHENQGRLRIGLAVAIVLGIVFVGLQGLEWSNKTFTPASHAYGSLYFTVTGFHLTHVLVGVLMLSMLFVWTLLGYFGIRRHSTISIAVMYWHFVTAVWVAVFLTFYVVPYLSR